MSGRLWNARLYQQMALVTFDIFVEVEPKKLTSSNDCATDGKENEVIQFFDSLPAGATFHRKEPQNKIILFIFEKSSYLFHPQNQDDEAIVKSFL